MQKSKKLMVSLCGLALSSLFIINNKSVVHADTVDANQNNNAISWDSDSDQAQKVQSNSQQSSVQNTQVADGYQQNVQSVQPSRAETSNVESSIAARSLTNQTKSVQVSNVNDAQKTSPVVINNPANDTVNVHYVDRNGNAINDVDVKNTTIDVTKTGQGSYSVPNGYSVNNPDGKYTISGGAFNVTNLKASTDYHRETYRTVYKTETWYGAVMRGGTTVPKATTYKDVQEINGTDDELGMHLIHIFPTKQQADSWNGGSGDYSTGPNDQTYYNDRTYYDVSPVTVTNVPKTAVETPAYTTQTLPVAFVDANNNLVGMVQNYTGKVGTTQNVNLTLPMGYKLADGQSLPTSVTFANNDKAQLIKVVPNNVVNEHNVVKAPHAAENANTFTFDVNENRYGHKLENGMLNDDDVSYLYKLFDATEDKPLYLVLSDYSDDNKGTIFSNGKLHTMVASKYNSADDAKKLKDICSKIHLGVERATDEVTIGGGVTITPKSLYQSDVMHVKFVDQSTGKEVAGGYDIDLSKAKSGSNYYNIPAGFGTAETMYTVVDHASSGSTFAGPRTGSLNEDDTTYILGKNYSGGAFNISTGINAGTGNIVITLPDRAAHLKFENGSTYGVDARMKNIWVNKFGFDDPDLVQAVTIVPNSGYYSFMDNYHEINGNTVTVPVHQSTSYMFADNSGNAVGAKGNTVNVALTKQDNLDPSKVNPNSPEWRLTHSSATRTIQLNFPGGTVPVSYKNIVDDKGVLIQTVNFTRGVQVDSLLDPSDPNYVISEGAWKSDNKDPNFIGFPERTLPKIPGYTLSIKPA